MARLPPSLLSVDELTVRTYEPADAPALVASVTESLEHLRPWMPWISYEPQTPEQRVALFGEWAGERLATGATTYGIFHGTAVVGGTGLHRRSAADVLEIGYWVHVGWVGRGVALRVAGALTTAAFGVDGIEAVEIVHDRRNAASGRVPERLGYRLVEEMRRPTAAPAESGLLHRWRTTRTDWTRITGSGPATTR